MKQNKATTLKIDCNISAGMSGLIGNGGDSFDLLENSNS